MVSKKAVKSITASKRRNKPDDLESFLKVSQVSKATGVSTSAINYYVRIGLLPSPMKTHKNMAYYDSSFIQMINYIKRLQYQKHLPLEKIKEIMDKKIEVWREMRSGAPSTASELFEGKMTPLTGEKKDDRRRIMEAAMRLFSKQGYSSTSEEEIADQAQVSMADFHEFFAGKEDLLLETAEEGVRVFNRRVSEEIAAVPDMLERIRIAIPVAFQILVENREIYTLYLEGSVLADTFYESKLMQNTASISYDLVATISRGIKDGSIRKVHPDIAANAIIGQLVRLANFWVEDPAKHNMGEITREAVEFVTRALSP